MGERTRVPTRNTDPPEVRCGLCGGRCRPWWGHPGWIECAGDCSWSSHHPDRKGLWWILRVLVGI